jgi:hypothetical protein
MTLNRDELMLLLLAVVARLLVGQVGVEVVGAMYMARMFLVDKRFSTGIHPGLMEPAVQYAVVRSTTVTPSD